jgi:hypothetical protein
MYLFHVLLTTTINRWNINEVYARYTRKSQTLLMFRSRPFVRPSCICAFMARCPSTVAYPHLYRPTRPLPYTESLPNDKIQHPRPWRKCRFKAEIHVRISSNARRTDHNARLLFLCRWWEVPLCKPTSIDRYLVVRQRSCKNPCSFFLSPVITSGEFL